MGSMRRSLENGLKKKNGKSIKNSLRGFRKGLWPVLWLWVCMAFWMTGCAGIEKEGEENLYADRVSLYRGDDTFINNIRGELEACAKEYEQKSGIKVDPGHSGCQGKPEYPEQSGGAVHFPGL